MENDPQTVDELRRRLTDEQRSYFSIDGERHDDTLALEHRGPLASERTGTARPWLTATLTATAANSISPFRIRAVDRPARTMLNPGSG
jgi:hypothetical protein